MRTIAAPHGRPSTPILLLALAGILASCGDEPPPPLDVPEGSARGVVFEDLNGNGIREEGEPGIPGVGVSDQLSVTETDQAGRWFLPGHEKAVYFVIKPRGYMTPVTEENLPRFYYLHNAGEPLELGPPAVPHTGPLPASIDFPLVRRAEPDSFDALFMGDFQPRDHEEVTFIAHDVLEELVGTSASFAVTLGDLTFDRLELYPHIKAVTGTVGIPFYHAMGNHDANYDAADTYDHYESWRTHFGPRYYSFDYGPVHFVILGDVLFPEGGTSYVAGFGEDQLAWLEADLARVPRDRLVVLSMHIPLRPADSSPEFARLYELLADRPHTLSFSAHSHVVQQGVLPEEFGWQGDAPHYHINAGAACGRWWGGDRDETDIPHATGSDGVPNGYFIVTFDGTGYSTRFKAARKPVDYQMEVQAPSQVEGGRLAETPVLVNFFNGSPDSTVEMMVGESGEWVPLEFAPQEDPLYAMIAERQNGWNASVANHIWEGRLPVGLAPGGHLIRIRATDHFGQEYSAARIVRVVDELPVADGANPS